MADVEAAPLESESAAGSQEAKADSQPAKRNAKRAKPDLKSADWPTISLAAATFFLVIVTCWLASVTGTLARVTLEEHTLIRADELLPPAISADRKAGSLELLPSSDHEQRLMLSCLAANSLPATDDELIKELSDSPDPQLRVARGQPSPKVFLANCHSPDKGNREPQFAVVALGYWSLPLYDAGQQTSPNGTLEIFRLKEDTKQYELVYYESDNESKAGGPVIDTAALTQAVKIVMRYFKERVSKEASLEQPITEPAPVPEQVADQPSAEFSAYPLQPARTGTLGR